MNTIKKSEVKKIVGKSTCVKDAKDILPSIIKFVDEFKCDIPTTQTVINWGAKSRGQGKRSGNMIMGGVSAAPVGLKTYYGVDLTKYENDFNGNMEWSYGDGSRRARYYKAREFGCNEIEARLYAIM